MKNILKTALCLPLLVACSGPIDDSLLDPSSDAGDQLGSLEQGLTRPVGFGFAANHLRCASTTDCRLPTDKTIYYKFFASTCTSWWQARWVQAVNDWIGQANPLGWNIQHEPNFPDYELRCYDVAGSNSGEFVPTLYTVGNHKRFNKGHVRIDAAFIESQPDWATHTDPQRQRKAENEILHELGHGLGFGHIANPANLEDATVMGGSASLFWSQKVGFEGNTVSYITGEFDMLAEFVP